MLLSTSGLQDSKFEFNNNCDANIRIILIEVNVSD